MISAACVTIMLVNYKCIFDDPSGSKYVANFIQRNVIFIAIKWLYLTALFVYCYFYVRHLSLRSEILY